MIVAVGIAYFLYNAGYWLPFGGGSPGPRFLIPALPFLAIGLAPAYRRLPALTLALAIPSVTFMVAGALTFPLIGDTGTGTWANQLGSGALEHTLLTVLGVHSGWLAMTPRARRGGRRDRVLRRWPRQRLRIGDLRPALAALLGWAVVSVVGPSVAGDSVTPLGDGPSRPHPGGGGRGRRRWPRCCALGYRERRAAEVAPSAWWRPEPPVGERIS